MRERDMHTLARKIVRATEDFRASLTVLEGAKTGRQRVHALAASIRATKAQQAAMGPVAAIPEDQIAKFSMILRAEEAVAKVRARRRKESTKT